jgi:hypothetical protein
VKVTLLGRPDALSSSRVRVWAIVGALVATVALRVLLVTTLPDGDLDSYGHFVAARALATAPRRLDLHWVWVPGWHFVVALLVKLRAGFFGARIFNATIAMLGPVVLYHLIAPRSRRAAAIAAIAWAIAPVSNLIATSAQSETLFALLLVCGCTAVVRRRGLQGGVLGGACLAAACLIRYEGWATLCGLALVCASGTGARSGAETGKRRATAIAVLIAAAFVVAWCALRARADGRWFAFVQETSRFVGGIDRSRGLASFFLYTLIIPVKIFGPAWVIALIGFRRAARAAPELAWASLAILGFLTATCLLGGSLGLERHFASLVPFACVGIGFGVDRLSTRLARAGVASLGAMLAIHVIVFVSTTRARWAPQLAAAAWIDAHAVPSDTPVVCSDLALELLLHRADRRFADELPAAGPAIIVGWEAHLGGLAREGVLAGRWAQDGPAGRSLVVRVVSADRARARASTTSSTASGMN